MFALTMLETTHVLVTQAMHYCIKSFAQVSLRLLSMIIILFLKISMNVVSIMEIVNRHVTILLEAITVSVALGIL